MLHEFFHPNLKPFFNHIKRKREFHTLKQLQLPQFLLSLKQLWLTIPGKVLFLLDNFRSHCFITFVGQKNSDTRTHQDKTFLSWNPLWVCYSWSEPAATSAPVQDEAVQAVLGMNQKHILFLCPGIFQPPSLPQNFPLLPTSSPRPTNLPPLTSFTSFPAHSISRARESSQAWVAQSFKEMWDIRLEEGGELNVEGMWRGESKRSASLQMHKREKKGKLSPFSTFFFFSMVFFSFFSSTWEKDAKEKVVEKKGKNMRLEVGATGERAEWELEGKLPPFSVVFFFSMGFFFFYLRRRRF